MFSGLHLQQQKGCIRYILNWSKEDMSAAASREIPMTKQVIDSLPTLGEAKKKIFIVILEGFTLLLLVLVVADIIIVFVATIVE